MSFLKETVGKTKAFLNLAKTLSVYIVWHSDDFWLVVNKTITGSFYRDEVDKFAVTKLAQAIARSLAEVLKTIGLQVNLKEVFLTKSINSLMAKKRMESEGESLILEWILSNCLEILEEEAE